MHSYKWRLASAYLLLVGLPIVAIVGILRAGAGLRAPLAVRGDWVMSADFQSWRQEPCATSLLDVSEPLMNISQSGRDLTIKIQLNKTDNLTMIGAIDSGVLTATDPAFLDKNELNFAREFTGEKALQIQGEVSGQGQSRSLTGRLTLKGRESCQPLAFRAIRRASADRGAS